MNSSVFKQIEPEIRALIQALEPFFSKAFDHLQEHASVDNLASTGAVIFVPSLMSSYPPKENSSRQ